MDTHNFWNVAAHLVWPKIRRVQYPNNASVLYYSRYRVTCSLTTMFRINGQTNERKENIMPPTKLHVRRMHKETDTLATCRHIRFVFSKTSRQCSLLNIKAMNSMSPCVCVRVTILLSSLRYFTAEALRERPCMKRPKCRLPYLPISSTNGSVMAPSGD